MNFRQNESRFWWQLLLLGAVAGALGGAIGIAILRVLAAEANSLLQWGMIPIAAIMGTVYGISQGLAQFLSLRQQIPPIRKSLRTNFISTAVGSTITGVLLGGLLAIGFANLLNSLGFSSTIILILATFIVGGFGGIAQAIVERFLLRAAVNSSYFRWIAPLALLGHVSGALAALVAAPFLQNLFASCGKGLYQI